MHTIDDFTRVKSPAPVSGCLQIRTVSSIQHLFHTYDRRFYTRKFVHNTLLSHMYICMYEYFAVYKYLYFSPIYYSMLRTMLFCCTCIAHEVGDDFTRVNSSTVCCTDMCMPYMLQCIQIFVFFSYIFIKLRVLDDFIMYDVHACGRIYSCKIVQLQLQTIVTIHCRHVHL